MIARKQTSQWLCDSLFLSVLNIERKYNKNLTLWLKSQHEFHYGCEIVHDQKLKNNKAHRVQKAETHFTKQRQFKESKEHRKLTIMPKCHIYYLIYYRVCDNLGHILLHECVVKLDSWFMPLIIILVIVLDTIIHVTFVTIVSKYN